MTIVIAIDAGTTGVRAFAVDEHGTPRAKSYREFPQHFPRPGWVEHDADDIWRVTQETLAECAREIDAIGETVVAVNAATATQNKLTANHRLRAEDAIADSA